MDELHLSREVDAPADTVWALMIDVDSWSSIVSGIDAVERLDDGAGFGVGTRWRETRTMFGKEATEDLEVTAMEPGRSYTVEAESRGAHYTSTMGVEPVGPDRSRLVTSFGAEPQGGFSKLMAKTVGKLFEGATRKALEQDLDDLAAAAEARARA